MNGLFEASVLNWVLIIIAAFIIGLSKAGIKGIDMMNVTIMALVFGSKASTGIVLPLLCAADILAVIYYHRHAQWDHFWKLMPWMMAGILIGVFVGKELDESVFKAFMAVIILLTVGVILFLEFSKRVSVPQNRSFAALMGSVSGFATMIGNLAGSISNIYFLAMRLPKNDFIGTAAWVFLVINFFKLPFQVIFWKNITPATLWTDLLLVPALLLGFFLGIVLTLLGALLILFR